MIGGLSTAFVLLGKGFDSLWTGPGMSVWLCSAQWWGCCPPCTWEMSYWCACLPWECLSSWKCPFFWGWAGVRRSLCRKILCVLSLNSLLTSGFDHFSLLVPPQLNTKLVCHLPAVLTCRCCFPELRETKLLGFWSTRCWRLCNFFSWHDLP